MDRASINGTVAQVFKKIPAGWRFAVSGSGGKGIVEAVYKGPPDEDSSATPTCIFAGGSPHPALRIGVRVVDECYAGGVLLGWKHRGERTGDTSGGLSSDGYCRVKFDSGQGGSGYNVDSKGVTFVPGGAAVLKWAASGSAVCIRHGGDVLWWSTGQGWQPSSEGGMSRIVGDFDALPLATAAQIASQCKGNLP